MQKLYSLFKIRLLACLTTFGSLKSFGITSTIDFESTQGAIIRSSSVKLPKSINPGIYQLLLTGKSGKSAFKKLVIN